MYGFNQFDWLYSVTLYTLVNINPRSSACFNVEILTTNFFLSCIVAIKWFSGSWVILNCLNTLLWAFLISSLTSCLYGLFNGFLLSGKNGKSSCALCKCFGYSISTSSK